MNKLKWQTGEPPENELLIFEVWDKNKYGQNEYIYSKVGYYPDNWYQNVSFRWVLYSDFLKVIEV